MATEEQNEEPIELTENSQCVVQSLGDRNNMIITRGIFKGYSRLGSTGETLCMEMDDSHGELAGKIRLIPAHMTLAIDLIVISEEEPEEEDDPHVGYYG